MFVYYGEDVGHFIVAIVIPTWPDIQMSLIALSFPIVFS